MRNTSSLYENVTSVMQIHKHGHVILCRMRYWGAREKRTNLTVKGTEIEEKRICQPIHSNYQKMEKNGGNLLSPRALFMPTNSLPNRPGESITDHQKR